MEQWGLQSVDVPQTDSWDQVGDSRGDFQRLTWPRDLRKSVRSEDAEMEWSGKVSFKGRAGQLLLLKIYPLVLLLLYLPRTDKECVN